MKDFFKQVWQMILDSNLLNVVGAIAILVIAGCSPFLFPVKSPSECRKFPADVLFCRTARKFRIFPMRIRWREK